MRVKVGNIYLSDRQTRFLGAPAPVKVKEAGVLSVE
jgi:hypothetical protein